MAKGQVTTDDLATGIKSFGGLTSLGAQPRPVRDNPFRDTRPEPMPPSVPVTPEPAPGPAAEPEAPRLEVVNGHENSGADAKKKFPTPEPTREGKPAAPRRVTPAMPVAAELVTGPQPGGRDKKTEIYTERVTVLLDAELRDGAEALAKKLQRSRTRKGERITANTIIRVALREMLENFHPPAFGMLNTEEDIHDFWVEQRSPR